MEAKIEHLITEVIRRCRKRVQTHSVNMVVILTSTEHVGRAIKSKYQAK